MGNKELYIIGTLHNDLDGEQRLDTLLNKLSPSAICLELHKDREEAPRQSREEINQRPEKIGLILTPKQKEVYYQISQAIGEVSGYEVRSSKRYVEKNLSSSLEYIDLLVYKATEKDDLVSGLEDVTAMSFDEDPNTLISTLAALNRGAEGYLEAMRKDIEQKYQNIKSLDEVYALLTDPVMGKMLRETMPPQVAQTVAKMFDPKRDEFMSTKIRELYEQKNNVVAIVGLIHAIPIGEYLSDLEPKIIPLNQYNSF